MAITISDNYFKQAVQRLDDWISHGRHPIGTLGSDGHPIGTLGSDGHPIGTLGSDASVLLAEYRALKKEERALRSINRALWVIYGEQCKKNTLSAPQQKIIIRCRPGLMPLFKVKGIR